jgi:hypothetical protein
MPTNPYQPPGTEESLEENGVRLIRKAFRPWIVLAWTGAAIVGAVVVVGGVIIVVWLALFIRNLRARNAEGESQQQSFHTRSTKVVHYALLNPRSTVGDAGGGAMRGVVG